ncbi:hypothetical protein NYZ42_16955 [Acinetobacter baumannii]|nr:hypothetical protein [Acinetobacter baumannii]
MSTLSDLNKHLFQQLDRLNDNTLKGENLKEEIDRANAMTSISKQVIDAHNTHLEAVKIIAEHKGLGNEQPAILSHTLRIN